VFKILISIFSFCIAQKKETKNASPGLFADPLFSSILNQRTSLQTVGFFQNFRKTGAAVAQPLGG
jgi:hypothetical protein